MNNQNNMHETGLPLPPPRKRGSSKLLQSSTQNKFDAAKPSTRIGHCTYENYVPPSIQTAPNSSVKDNDCIYVTSACVVPSVTKAAATYISCIVQNTGKNNHSVNYAARNRNRVPLSFKESVFPDYSMSNGAPSHFNRLKNSSSVPFVDDTDANHHHDHSESPKAQQNYFNKISSVGSNSSTFMNRSFHQTPVSTPISYNQCTNSIPDPVMSTSMYPGLPPFDNRYNDNESYVSSDFLNKAIINDPVDLNYKSSPKFCKQSIQNYSLEPPLDKQMSQVSDISDTPERQSVNDIDLPLTPVFSRRLPYKSGNTKNDQSNRHSFGTTKFPLDIICQGKLLEVKRKTVPEEFASILDKSMFRRPRPTSVGLTQVPNQTNTSNYPTCRSQSAGRMDFSKRISPPENATSQGKCRSSLHENKISENKDGVITHPFGILVKSKTCSFKLNSKNTLKNNLNKTKSFEENDKNEVISVNLGYPGIVPCPFNINENKKIGKINEFPPRDPLKQNLAVKGVNRKIYQDKPEIASLINENDNKCRKGKFILSSDKYSLSGCQETPTKEVTPLMYSIIFLFVERLIAKVIKDSFDVIDVKIKESLSVALISHSDNVCHSTDYFPERNLSPLKEPEFHNAMSVNKLEEIDDSKSDNFDQYHHLNSLYVEADKHRVYNPNIGQNQNLNGGLMPVIAQKDVVGVNKFGIEKAEINTMQSIRPSNMDYQLVDKPVLRREVKLNSTDIFSEWETPLPEFNTDVNHSKTSFKDTFTNRQKTDIGKTEFNSNIYFDSILNGTNSTLENKEYTDKNLIELSKINSALISSGSTEKNGCNFKNSEDSTSIPKISQRKDGRSSSGISGGNSIDDGSISEIENIFSSVPAGGPEEYFIQDSRKFSEGELLNSSSTSNSNQSDSLNFSKFYPKDSFDSDTTPSSIRSPRLSKQSSSQEHHESSPNTAEGNKSYGSEDFDIMDVEMRKLEAKLKMFEDELGMMTAKTVVEPSHSNSTSGGSQAENEKLMATQFKSNEVDVFRTFSLPKVYPPVSLLKTKHLSLMKASGMLKKDVNEADEIDSKVSISKNSTHCNKNSISKLLSKHCKKVRQKRRKSLDIQKLIMNNNKGSKSCISPQESSDFSLHQCLSNSQILHSNDNYCPEISEEFEYKTPHSREANLMNPVHFEFGFLWHDVDSDMTHLSFDALDQFADDEIQNSLFFIFEDDENDNIDDRALSLSASIDEPLDSYDNNCDNDNIMSSFKDSFRKAVQHLKPAPNDSESEYSMFDFGTSKNNGTKKPQNYSDDREDIYEQLWFNCQDNETKIPNRSLEYETPNFNSNVDHFNPDMSFNQNNNGGMYSLKTQKVHSFESKSEDPLEDIEEWIKNHQEYIDSDKEEEPIQTFNPSHPKYDWNFSDTKTDPNSGKFSGNNTFSTENVTISFNSDGKPTRKFTKNVSNYKDEEDEAGKAHIISNYDNLERFSGDILSVYSTSADSDVLL